MPKSRRPGRSMDPGRAGGAGLCPSAAREAARQGEAAKEGAQGGTMGSPVPSLVPELGETALVDPEVVPELVEDRDPDLLLELGRVAELVLERQAVDRDPVRE